MHTFKDLPQENQTSHSHENTYCQKSLYRSKWLAAHNRLHDPAHGKASPNWWDDYLAELELGDLVDCDLFTLLGKAGSKS